MQQHSMLIMEIMYIYGVKACINSDKYKAIQNSSSVFFIYFNMKYQQSFIQPTLTKQVNLEQIYTYMQNNNGYLNEFDILRLLLS